MKNATIPSNAIPPATESPMIDPVPSPELSLDSGGGGVGVGVLLEGVTVKTMTVVEPSAPVLWMLLSCSGAGDEFCDGGVEVGP